MTGEKKMFTSYVKNKDSQDTIIFGDGNQGKVKGLGKIAITNEHSISNVFFRVAWLQPPVCKSIVPHGLQLFVYKCRCFCKE
jgi:hypothetical protein